VNGAAKAIAEEMAERQIVDKNVEKQIVDKNGIDSTVEDAKKDLTGPSVGQKHPR
jgi:hypothetical protein